MKVIEKYYKYIAIAVGFVVGNIVAFLIILNF